MAGASLPRPAVFNPTLRTSSLPYQIATNRVADWIGARLVPSTSCPRPGASNPTTARTVSMKAAHPDRRGRTVVFLEVDLGNYSRERILGKFRAFRASERARCILFVTPSPERAQLVVDWIGETALDEVQALSFDELRAGTLDPGTEPIREAGRADGLAA